MCVFYAFGISPPPRLIEGRHTEEKAGKGKKREKGKGGGEGRGSLDVPGIGRYPPITQSPYSIATLFVG